MIDQKPHHQHHSHQKILQKADVLGKKLEKEKKESRVERNENKRKKRNLSDENKYLNIIKSIKNFMILIHLIRLFIGFKFAVMNLYVLVPFSYS